MITRPTLPDSLPDDVRAELVDMLYRSLPNVVAVVVTGCVAGFYIAFQTGSASATGLAGLIVVTAALRIGLFKRFPHGRVAQMPRSEIDAWARAYGGLSVAFGLMLGLLTLHAFWAGLGLEVVVPVTLVSAYAVGATCRTAVVPWITVGTASAMLGPTILGALLRPELALQITGVFLVVELLATLECARYVHQAFAGRLLAQREANRLAAHDGLTGLPNRTSLRDHLRAACARSEGGPAFGLLCLDLDGFKAVNDTHGHAAGDALLCEVAARLRAALRPGDVVGRLGGDEFAVLTAAGTGREAACALAARIVAALDEPFHLEGGADVTVGTSVGVAVWGEHGTTLEELSRRADAALYEAKRAGRHTWRLAEQPHALAA